MTLSVPSYASNVNTGVKSLKIVKFIFVPNFVVISSLFGLFVMRAIGSTYMSTDFLYKLNRSGQKSANYSFFSELILTSASGCPPAD